VGDISYRPLIEDFVWSYSRVSSFDDCPYKWFMKYISGDSEQPTFYASYGSFIHSLIERYYSGELKREELPMAFLLGFSAGVRGERPSDKIVRNYIAAGKRYFDTFSGLPLEKVSVEEELRFDVDGIPFVAFTDFIGRKDGALAIVDHKSRDLKPRSRRRVPTVNDRELDEMLRQLYLYAHGVFQKYGELPKQLCFNCFRTGRLIWEPFDKKTYMLTLDWIKRQIETISEEETFCPCMDFFRCRYLCGLHDKCCYYLGG